VTAYSVDWLLRAVTTSVLFICPNSVKNPSSSCSSSIVMSTSSCFVSVSSLCFNRPLTLSNSTRNTLK
jgi:hypothetical protein